MDASRSFLSPLRDVAGVLGSFFLDRSGAVAASDLPPMLGTELLREAGERILLLEETLGVDGKGPDSVVLRFDHQRLHLRFVPNGVFGVLAQHEINAASLKMALTLVSRRMREPASAGVASDRTSSPPERASEPPELPPDTRRSPVFAESGGGAPTSAPVSPPSPADDGGVIYRGRRIR